MKNVVFYDVSGRITAACSLQDQCLTGETRTYLEVAAFDPQYPQTHWVTGGVLTACATITATLDNATQTLTGLPDPCSLRIEDTEYPTTGGTAELSFGLPGSYVVRVTAPGYLTTSFTVTV